MSQTRIDVNLKLLEQIVDKNRDRMILEILRDMNEELSRIKQDVKDIQYPDRHIGW